MEEPEKTMVEVREELMVFPTDQNQNPCSKTAHFLKPIFSSFKNQLLPKLPSQHQLSSSSAEEQNKKRLPLRISFPGWRCRAKHWRKWIQKMAALHEPTWKKAGIHEAIMNSTYNIKRNKDLVLCLAERWCCDTKSFVFSWGEASVTLEDIMILGGFSVLGSPVFAPLETEETKRVEESLKSARMEIVRSKAKKACPRLWMQKFMDSSSEFEHEAFLAFWLSRYVFTNAHETIREHVFSIAVHLARGKMLALAPAVLASIYRDLCLLKNAIISAASNELGEKEGFTVTIWSPFQLVQVWAWERFVELRPKPNLMTEGQPRLVQWHDVSCKVENVSFALDSSSASCFQWRPYALQAENWKQPKFYRENDVCISITAHLDKELESFARCLKVSELVGLDCIEHYLPHRVAMQFGIDQDIPGFVHRLNDTPDIAWLDYCESLTGVKLYIPSRLYKAGVTTRYLKWWKQSVLESEGTVKGLKRLAKNPKGMNQGKSSYCCCHGFHWKIDNFRGKIEANDQSVSRNYSTKSSKKQGDSVNGNNSTNGSCKGNSKKAAKNVGNVKGKEDSSCPTLPFGSSKESGKTFKRKRKLVDKEPASSRFCHGNSKKLAQVMKDKKEGNSDSAPWTIKRKKGSNSFIPIDFAPNFDRNEAENTSCEKDNNPTIAEIMRSCKKRAKIRTKDCDDDGNASGHSRSYSSIVADDEANKYLEPLAILAEKVMQDESVLRLGGTFKGVSYNEEPQKAPEQVVMGESKRSVKDENWGNPELPIHKKLHVNGVEGDCSCNAVDIPGLTLEARISRLEKLTEKLKAMRSACK